MSFLQDVIKIGWLYLPHIHVMFSLLVLNLFG